MLLIRKPLVIGITGSAGKTTTTEMLGGALTHKTAQSTIGRVRYTKRNMNCDRGLPLTVLCYDSWLSEMSAARVAWLVAIRTLALATGLGPYPKVLVLEFATNRYGQLQRLARLAPPTIGIVTLVGPAHLEKLETIENVVHEKSAIVSATPPSGLIILGQSHKHVTELEKCARAPVVKVDGEGLELSKNITLAVCRQLNIPEHVASSAFQSFRRPPHRLVPLYFDCMTVIDDTFNANPVSMKLALDTLAEMANGRRRLAVLGEMTGLGEKSPAFHLEVGALARNRAEVIVGVGILAKHYGPDHWFETSEVCAGQIARLLRPNDCLLVKGSHSVGMVLIVKRLRTLAEKHTAQAALLCRGRISHLPEG